MDNRGTPEDPAFMTTWQRGRYEVGLGRNYRPGMYPNGQRDIYFSIRCPSHGGGQFVVDLSREELQDLFRAYVQIARAYEEHP